MLTRTVTTSQELCPMTSITQQAFQRRSGQLCTQAVKTQEKSTQSFILFTLTEASAL